MITDHELTKLRSQTEFNALLGEKVEWRQLADALRELQERREKEKQQETA